MIMQPNENNWPEMQLTPVGMVKSDIKTPLLTAGDSDLELQDRMEQIREYHRKVQACVCELTIFPHPENISEVDIKGVDVELSYELQKHLTHFANYNGEAGMFQTDVRDSDI